MKTRQQSIDDFRHEVSGIVLEAAINQRKGGELSIWMRACLVKIDRLSAKLYDDATAAKPAEPAPPVNGHVKQPQQANTK